MVIVSIVVMCIIIWNEKSELFMLKEICKKLIVFILRFVFLNCNRVMFGYIE